MQFGCAKHNSIKTQIEAIAQEIEEIANAIAQNSKKIPSDIKFYSTKPIINLSYLAKKLIKFKNNADKQLNKFLQKLQRINAKSQHLTQSVQRSLSKLIRRIVKLQTNHLAHLRYELEKLRILGRAQDVMKEVEIMMQGPHADRDPQEVLATILSAEAEAKENLNQCKREINDLIAGLPKKDFEDVRVGLEAAVQILESIEQNISRKIADKKAELGPSVEGQIKTKIEDIYQRCVDADEHITELLKRAKLARKNPEQTAEQLRELADRTREAVEEQLERLQQKQKELEGIQRTALQLKNLDLSANISVIVAPRVAAVLRIQTAALAKELDKLETAAQNLEEQLQAVVAQSGEAWHHHHHHHHHGSGTRVPVAPLTPPVSPLAPSSDHPVSDLGPAGVPPSDARVPVAPSLGLGPAAASRKSSVEQRSIELSLLRRDGAWWMRYKDTTPDTQPKPGGEAPGKQEKSAELQEEELKNAPEKIEPQALLGKLQEQVGNETPVGGVVIGKKLTSVDGTDLDKDPPKIKLRIKAHSREEALRIAKTLVRNACQKLKEEETLVPVNEEHTSSTSLRS